MIEEIRVIELADQVKLHLIKSDKFKTDLIGIYIKRPLTEKEATYNTLLTRILEQATENYPTSQVLHHKLDNLYGGILSCDVNKYGELHAMQFKLQLPNERHIKESNLFGEGLHILNDVLNNPLISNGKFRDDIFRNEVKNLREEIQGRINDKMVYAIDRCTENMCDKEAFKYYQYGTVEMLDTITNEGLVNHYYDLVKTSPIDIVVVGEMDFDKTQNVMMNAFSFERGDIISIPESVTDVPVEKVRSVHESFDVSQAKLTLGLRTNIAFSHPLYNASVLFSNILGGGASSKLFKNVREKASLCYYIFSRIEKYKGMMLISSGIEAKDKQKALDLIQIEMDNMTAGAFDDDDIKIAKDALTSAVRSISDYPNSFMNFYYSQKLSGKEFDLQGVLAKIELVSKEEIIEAGKLMEVDTIYFLSKEGA